MQDKMDATWTSNQLARSWSSLNWIVSLNPLGVVLLILLTSANGPEVKEKVQMCPLALLILC